MPQSRRTRWVVAGPLVAALVLLGACGDDDDDGGDATGSTAAGDTAPGDTAADTAAPGGGDPAVSLVATADLAVGDDVFSGNCSQCHGDDGAGGIGPNLQDVAERLSVEEQVEVVREGRGAMPPWDGELTDEEIAAVVRYTREGL